ncbi:MAG: universal stress protein [Caldimicrobium sp.]|nr:universal stress protein [Caldimicrobium sp.]MCX7873974.1 universal stress protein [Caldimicrobium sp.]MDW8094187.1 universal stress protein [Caldimicrobium sp.]
MDEKICCPFGNLKNVVLVTDASQSDDILVQTAIKIAQCCQATLHVLCYAEISHLLADVWESVPYVSDVVEQRVDTKLKQIKETCIQKNIPVKTTCFIGEGPEEYIIKEAKAIGADLIVMGRMRSPLRLLKKKIIGGAPCDVLIIPLEVKSFEINKILVATDGSLQSRVAVEKAMEIAQNLGIPMIVMSVAKKLENLPYAEEAVNSAAKEAEARGIKVEREVLQGEPFKMILERGENSDVGLLVLGKYGRTGLERLLIGSVSERVASFSSKPILVTTKKGA